jgi:hypothetical protein
MDTTRTRWNDDRLGEFASDVKERFDQVGRRFDRIDDRQVVEFGRVNDRLDDLVKVLIGGVIALTAAIIAGFSGIIVLIATQL